MLDLIEKNEQSDFPSLFKCKICIIGLGYVGLPLAIEFSKVKKCLITDKTLKRKVVGFDLNKKRIDELCVGKDITREIEKEDLKELKSIEFISEPNTNINADVYIVSVPTPISKDKKPNLSFLKKATEQVALFLKKGTQHISPLIIFESTVYPGTTEDICVPILQEHSGLKINEDFYCGYSPERINPGDKEHKLSSITKVTSGSNNASANWIDNFYGSIIKAGTFKAKSIRVAEAAKVIENTQRDLNIALVNELAKICKAINIDTLDVLSAAESKWNFMPFRPGLVGGHCISVDPYYLTYIAKMNGYQPDIVLAGRNLNDGMSGWIVEQIIEESQKKKIEIKQSKVLIMGITFKENCPDIRNSKVFDVIRILNEKGIIPQLFDPYISEETNMENIKFKYEKKIPLNKNNKFDVVIVCVAHDEFKNINVRGWKNILKENYIIFDLKGIIPRLLNPIRL